MTNKIIDDIEYPLSAADAVYLAKEIMNARKDSRHRRLDTEQQAKAGRG